MKLLKLAVRKILSLINQDLEYRMVEQFHFGHLQRKPPEFIWKALPSCPEARLDAGRGQIGHELFVFGGFRYDDSSVVEFIDIFDMNKEKWTARLPMPAGLAHTHLGVVSDEKRFVYLVSGQVGGHCLPATANCFAFDAENRSFSRLPPLPIPRYAPAVQLCKGRLHSMGGAKEDRNTPAVDHWSIAVENGKALETEWRPEPAIPHGGHHRASAVVNDMIYVFGGQEGDYVAIPGDKECRCTAELTAEIRFPDTYRYDPATKKWQRRADMPVLSSHTESSVINLGEQILILGGDFERQANKDILRINDEIQLYDARDDSWKVIGRLPYRVKAMIGGYYQGNLYISTGQRGVSVDDPTPLNRFEPGTWRARIKV